MKVLAGVLAMVTSVAFLGCAPDDSIGPRVAPGLVVTEADAANNKANDFRPGAKAKVYCKDATSCYAAAFYFTDYPSHPTIGGPYTLFTAYFQNLQGTYPLGGPSTVLGLGHFGFRFLVGNAVGDTYVDASNGHFSITAVGNVQEGIGNSWPQNATLNPGQEFPNIDRWDAFSDSWIVGCTVPEGVPNWFGKRTCPSQGLDGWVKVEFVLRRLTGFFEGGPSSTAIRPPVRFEDFLFTFGPYPVADPVGCTIGGGLPGTCTELSYKQAMRN